jgi:hypothetical protein
MMQRADLNRGSLCLGIALVFAVLCGSPGSALADCFAAVAETTTLLSTGIDLGGWFLVYFGGIGFVYNDGPWDGPWMTTDGRTWTQIIHPDIHQNPETMWQVACAMDGTAYILRGGTIEGTPPPLSVYPFAMWNSTDGAAWSPVAVNPALTSGYPPTLPGAYYAFAFGSTLIMMNASPYVPGWPTVWRSDNGGVDWTELAEQPFYGYNIVDHVLFGSDMYVRVAPDINYPVWDSKLYRSSDGNVWTEITTIAQPEESVSDLVVFQGKLYAALCDRYGRSRYPRRLASSSDGAVWTEVSGFEVRNGGFFDLAATPDLAVALCQNEYPKHFLVSEDGAVWRNVDRTVLEDQDWVRLLGGFGDAVFLYSVPNSSEQNLIWRFDPTSGTGIIGPLGGSVTISAPSNPATGAGVIVPKGALAEDAVVTVAENTGVSAPPDSLGLLLAIDYSPDGSIFAPRATIMLPYSPDDLAALDATPAQLMVWDYDAGAQIPYFIVDTRNDRVLAEVDHFSTYGLVVAVAVPAAGGIWIALMALALVIASRLIGPALSSSARAG